ncbi:MAG: M50 family metallopeptidase [Actinomycetota bacterium]
MGALIFALGLLVVIMFHEAGHLMVAKAFGFKATKFFLGFGPTVWSFTRGETEYGIKALPLGGFVKIIGMNPYEEIPEQDRPRAYGSKPRWQRALLLVAGSAMHFVLVFVVLVGALMWLGVPTASSRVLGVEPGSPAATSVLRSGDTIVGIEGEETTSWTRIRRYIRGHGGEETTFTVARGGESREVTVELGYAVYRGGELRDSGRTRAEVGPLQEGENLVGYLGVAPAAAYETEPLPVAVTSAAGQIGGFSRDSMLQIGQVFENFWNGQLFGELGGAQRTPEDSPIGIVGAGRFAQEIAERGFYFDLVYMLCGLTILIGIMNLLPLPPLDGGHLAVVGWEAITGRSVDLRKIIPVAAAVIAFFSIYFVAVLYLDITRPIQL